MLRILSCISEEIYKKLEIFDIIACLQEEKSHPQRPFISVLTSAVSGFQVTGAMFTEVPRVCAVVDGVTRVTNVREDARTGRTRRAMIAAMCKTYFIDN